MTVYEDYCHMQIGQNHEHVNCQSAECSRSTVHRGSG